MGRSSRRPFTWESGMESYIINLKTFLSHKWWVVFYCKLITNLQLFICHFCLFIFLHVLCLSWLQYFVKLCRVSLTKGKHHGKGYVCRTFPWNLIISSFYWKYFLSSVVNLLTHANTFIHFCAVALLAWQLDPFSKCFIFCSNSSIDANTNSYIAQENEPIIFTIWKSYPYLNERDLGLSVSGAGFLPFSVLDLTKKFSFKGNYINQDESHF